MRTGAIRSVVSAAHAALKACLIAPIRFYQYVLSPWLGRSCRFTPSCSAYAIGAIERHGAARGLWLALCRVARCHPWSPGGLDPVPPRHHAPCSACAAAPTEPERAHTHGSEPR